MSNAKIWFVTGASSGFGRVMTEHLLKTGHKVVATLRKPEALSDLTTHYPPTQLVVVKVDVINKADITTAFAKAEELFGRIDVVFNNAGIGIAGEVESMGDADAQAMLDVNFWGAAHVSREAVRFFRETNKPMGGRLLQVSSTSGLGGSAACAYYSASKFALEGFSESLAYELDPAWNIKITIIEPGPFRTEICGKNRRAVPQHPAYADADLPGSQIRKLLASSELWNGDVAKAVIVIEKVSQLDNPPIRFPLHKMAVEALRGKAKGYAEIADTYESWSDDLYHDNNGLEKSGSTDSHL